MQCPNCKKELADNAKTCPNCGYDFTEAETEKSIKTGCGCLVVIVVVLACILSSCIVTTDEENISNNVYRKCSQDLLHQFAPSEEDLLITHEATGIIEDYAEYAGQYVVKVNRSLWDSTNWEQRQLIRCSTETVAHKKGLKGVVLDYKLNEKLN